jgi:polysaccharide export outer membrane protein
MEALAIGKPWVMRNEKFTCVLAVVLSLPGQVGRTQQAGDLPPLTQDVSRSESSTGTTETVTNFPTVSTTKMHVLVPDDLVEIKVYQQPDLETKARIDQDGTVIMPLLGSINLSEKTIEQARAMIRERLAKDYLVNPQVSVTVIEYAKRMFTILGEVQRPGTYEIPAGQPFSLLQAIALAGGYTRIGSPGKVIVQRIEKGQKKVFSLDAGSMAKDERAKPFEVLPNDNITVGERLF